ncbi:uncharacterized protein LOC129243132 [Anastrepha obliqua]|uniref:uncharacterized protein LOC129243132 n=1 Tax=Anastrepha obliqua TaxID=95512 RepID=UPI002409DF29|nr:uncharacterized protein LOC129243132 [Anastrepha obliqua]
MSKNLRPLGPKLQAIWQTSEQRLTLVENKINSHVSLPASNEAVFVELSERKRREANVIAFNVPESSKATGKERLEDDRSSLSSILPPELSCDSTGLKLRRLGRHTPGRSRPLLVVTPTATDALTLLKSKPADGNTTISFKPDLTPTQQEYLKSLRSDLASLEKNGDLSKTIKYVNGIPKIVTKNFRSIREEEESDKSHRLLPECSRSTHKTL